MTADFCNPTLHFFHFTILYNNANKLQHDHTSNTKYKRQLPWQLGQLGLSPEKDCCEYLM